MPDDSVDNDTLQSAVRDAIDTATTAIVEAVREDFGPAESSPQLMALYWELQIAALRHEIIKAVIAWSRANMALIDRAAKLRE